VVDVSDSRAVITLSGPRALDVLAKGCPLDLHPRVFSPGRCAQSLLAKAHVLLHRVDDAPTFEIYVHRSFADYLWTWLEDAAAEYGMAVRGG
jgi:sarcosine oxidase subunit gamma